MFFASKIPKQILFTLTSVMLSALYQKIKYLSRANTISRILRLFVLIREQNSGFLHFYLHIHTRRQI